MRVIVRLFDQTELLSLRLVETSLHTVRFLETLQRQDQQLGVVFVRERGEGNRGESPALQPVNWGRGFKLLSSQLKLF